VRVRVQAPARVRVRVLARVLARVRVLARREPQRLPVLLVLFRLLRPPWGPLLPQLVLPLQAVVVRRPRRPAPPARIKDLSKNKGASKSDAPLFSIRPRS
jgi:hypothetical protein